MNSTTVEYGHLSPKAQEYLDLPTKDRIRKIQEGTWLQLDHATTTLQKLEDLLDYPKVTRMPSYLIVGPSYSGKTSILERFRDQHLPDVDPEHEATRCPVVMVCCLSVSRSERSDKRLLPSGHLSLDRETRTDGWRRRTMRSGKAMGPNQSTRQRPSLFGNAFMRNM